MSLEDPLQPFFQDLAHIPFFDFSDLLALLQTENSFSLVPLLFLVPVSLHMWLFTELVSLSVHPSQPESPGRLCIFISPMDIVGAWELLK